VAPFSASGSPRRCVKSYGFAPARRWFEFPGLNSFLSGAVHFAGGTADELDILHRSIRLNRERNNCGSYKTVLSSRLGVSWIGSLGWFRRFHVFALAARNRVAWRNKGCLIEGAFAERADVDSQQRAAVHEQTELSRITMLTEHLILGKLFPPVFIFIFCFVSENLIRGLIFTHRSFRAALPNGLRTNFKAGGIDAILTSCFRFFHLPGIAPRREHSEEIF
jgi:hypothetical protein